MLFADKELLESELKKKAIVLQDKELAFYMNNSNVLATQASLLAGFSYGGLLKADFNGIFASCAFMRIVYYLVTGVAMGSALCCLMLSVLCNILAPGLALQGPAGSMKRAVDGMAEAQRWTTRIFLVSLFSFNFSGIFYAWIAFQEPSTAVLLTFLLLIITFALWFLWNTCTRAFSVHSSRLVSGTFHGSELAKGMEDASLLVRTRQDATSNLSGQREYVSIV